MFGKTKQKTAIVVTPINQQNYEEFFLLYADGELNAQDRFAVEQFAQANPDLAVELDLLLQMRLPQDEHLVFADKSSLFRSEAAAINLQNYEEQFLLYVDNELGQLQKQEVETFVLQHPALQQGFTALMQTKLETETIVFTEKASLYRKEEKERPVLHWQRVAVAAVMAGLAVLVWTLLPQTKNERPLLAKQTTTETGNGIVNPAIQPGSTTDKRNTEVPDQRNTHPVQTAASGKNTDGKIRVLVAGVQEITPQKEVENTPNKDIIAKADPVIRPLYNGLETLSSNTQKLAGNNTVMDALDKERTHPAEETNNSNMAEAQPAVYRELDTESADEKKSLRLGSLEINKDKLRGFFRKAGSLFRGKGKNEDERSDATPNSTHSLK